VRANPGTEIHRVASEVQNIVVPLFPEFSVARVMGQEHRDYLEYCLYHNEACAKYGSDYATLHLIVSPDAVQLRRKSGHVENGRWEEIQLEWVMSEKGLFLAIYQQGREPAVGPAAAVPPVTLEGVAGLFFTFSDESYWKQWYAKLEKDMAMSRGQQVEPAWVGDDANTASLRQSSREHARAGIVQSMGRQVKLLTLMISIAGMLTAVALVQVFRYETVVVSIGNGGYVLRRDRLLNEYCVVHGGTWDGLIGYPHC
jgi:hypothetical protein